MSNDNNDFTKNLIESSLSESEERLSDNFLKNAAKIKERARKALRTFKISSKRSLKYYNKSDNSLFFGKLLKKAPLKNITRFLNIKDDLNKSNNNYVFAVSKNIVSGGVGKVAGVVTTGAIAIPTGGTDAPVAIVGGIAADAATTTAIDKGFDKAYDKGYFSSEKWKKFYEKYLNQQTNQSSANTGLSNSDGVAERLITKPDPTQIVYPNYLTPDTAGIGSIIGNMLGSFAGVALGAIASKLILPMEKVYPTGLFDDKGNPIRFHTGGTIPGTGEVLSVLMGGETVRTKAQEKELQEMLIKNHLENYVPTVSGEDAQGKNHKKQKNPKESNKPIYQQLTKEDESFILGLVIDAIERNKMGLRHLIKAI